MLLKRLFYINEKSCFGKNIRKFEKENKLTSNGDTYTKHAARVNFISGKLFNEPLFAMNRIKEEMVLNRPIYVRMVILDLL